jgi:DtxR family Mn-dependent transcriptional regulator
MQVTHTVAEKDACMMEHELHPETIDQLRMFLTFIREDSRAASVLEQFHTYTRVKKAAISA